MKRPSMQWYPADWRNNAKLRSCSWAARGAWIDVLGVLHDSDEYGIQRLPLRRLAHQIGAPLALLRELATAGVIKGSDDSHEGYVYTPRHANRDGTPVTLIEPGKGPLWFSSRMVRDEHVRQHRGASTRYAPTDQSPIPPIGATFGATPKPPPKPPPMPGLGDGASSSSSISSMKLVVEPTHLARATPTATSTAPLKRVENQRQTVEIIDRWWTTEAGTNEQAKLLGMMAGGGESWDNYRARIRIAITRRLQPQNEEDHAAP